MTCNRISIAVGVGDDQVRSNIKIPCCQGLRIDTVIPVDQSIDLGVHIDPARVTGFFAQSDGDVQIEFEDRHMELRAGVPCMWYEGIGTDIDQAVCGTASGIVVVNKGDEPVGFSLRTSQRLDRQAIPACGAAKQVAA